MGSCQLFSLVLLGILEIIFSFWVLYIFLHNIDFKLSFEQLPKLSFLTLTPIALTCSVIFGVYLLVNKKVDMGFTTVQVKDCNESKVALIKTDKCMF